MLISEEYRELNRQLHADCADYGAHGVTNVEPVLAYCQGLGTNDVLDYGCGKGNLAKALPFPIKEYDPAIPGKDGLAEPADLVFCGDVLEHIEPEYLDAVLTDLQRCVKKMGILLIHCGPANKILADGRNAHLIQETPKWWMRKLLPYFDIVLFVPHPQGVQINVEPKLYDPSATV